MDDFFEHIKMEDSIVKETEHKRNGFRFLIKCGLFEVVNPYTNKIVEKLLRRNIDALILSNSIVNIEHIEYIDDTGGAANIDMLMNGEFHSTGDCLSFIWCIISVFFKYNGGNNGVVSLSYAKNELENTFTFYSTFRQYIVDNGKAKNFERAISDFTNFIKFLISDESEYDFSEVMHFVYSKLPNTLQLFDLVVWHKTFVKFIDKEKQQHIIGNEKLNITPNEEKEIFKGAIKNLIHSKKVLFSGLQDLIRNQEKKKIELNVCVKHISHVYSDKKEQILFNPYTCNIIAISGTEFSLLFSQYDTFNMPNLIRAFFDNYKKLINVKNSNVLKTLDSFDREFLIFNNSYAGCSERCPVFSVIFYMGTVLDENTNENYMISVCLSGMLMYLKRALEDLHNG